MAPNPQKFFNPKGLRDIRNFNANGAPVCQTPTLPYFSFEQILRIITPGFWVKLPRFPISRLPAFKIYSPGVIIIKQSF